MYLHIGSYSGHVISYQGLLNNFTPLHNFQASESSIRSMARSEKYLLAGGYDELLHIYSIVSNTQEGEINCQQGAINKIRIVGDMVLTGGEDGSVCVWKLGSWERVHRAKEHKSIETMDVHPSGKIMITVGKERKLILWNLLKFIRVLDIKLDFDAKKVLFVEDLILIVSDTAIYQLDTSTNTTTAVISEKSKFQDAIGYLNYIITSHENGEIKFFSTTTGWGMEICVSHGKNRVKCLGLIELEGNDLLVSADSEGEIKFWHLPSLLGKEADVGECVILEKKVGQRVLCICAGMEFEEEQGEEQGQGEGEEGLREIEEEYQDEEEQQEVQQRKSAKSNITKKIFKNKEKLHSKNKEIRNKIHEFKNKNSKPQVSSRPFPKQKLKSKLKKQPN